MARDLVTQEIPNVLRKLALKNDPELNAIYFRIEDWKWYEGNPDVAVILQWFDTLDEEDFAAIRLGEEASDITEWGCPVNYDIYPVSYIHCPV